MKTFGEFYHGTNTPGAASIRQQGILLFMGRGVLDFDPMGRQGFYVTDSLQHAKSRARQIALILGGTPEVLMYEVPLQELRSLYGLTLTDGHEWVQFVRAGRAGTLQHAYEYVEGPYVDNPGQVMAGALPTPKGYQLAIYSDRAVALFNRSVR